MYPGEERGLVLRCMGRMKGKKVRWSRSCVMGEKMNMRMKKRKGKYAQR